MVRPAGDVDQRRARVEDGVEAGRRLGAGRATGGPECWLFRKTRRRSPAAGWCCRQPNTGRPSPKPGPARPRETRIGARRGKPGGWVALDLSLGLVQRGPKGANGLHALALFVVQYEGVDLTYGPRAVHDQRRKVALRGDAAACFVGQGQADGADLSDPQRPETHPDVGGAPAVGTT